MRSKTSILIICLFFIGCAFELPEDQLRVDRHLNKKFCLVDSYDNSGVWLLRHTPYYDSLLPANQQMPNIWVLVFEKPDYLAADSNVVLAERIKDNKKVFFIGTARWKEPKYWWFEFKDSSTFIAKRKELGIPDTLTLRKVIGPVRKVIGPDYEEPKRNSVNIGHWSRY
jgi:hypothetical protein